jgi:hypothetical protein
VVCPGSLAEQWQDELYRRFHLKFDILTNDKLESSATGNWFRDTNLAIARLDKLSRNDDVQAKLLAPDCQWDLVVCDEAHKMSATFFGGDPTQNSICARVHPMQGRCLLAEEPMREGVSAPGWDAPRLVGAPLQHRGRASGGCVAPCSQDESAGTRRDDAATGRATVGHAAWRS